MSRHTPLPSELASSTFAVSEALALEVNRERLRSPDLSAPHWGIRTHGGAAEPAGPPPNNAAEYPDWVSRRRVEIIDRAAALRPRLSENAVYSGATAAMIHGLPIPRFLMIETELTVARPATERAMDCQGVRGRALDLHVRDMTSIGGLPVTSVERTWCDLAARLSLPQLVSAGDAALNWRHPLTTPAALFAGMTRFQSRRGIRNIRLALPLLTSHSDSPKESELRMAIIGSGLPRPVPNFLVTYLDGHPLHVDLAFPDHKVALEFEGDGHRTEEIQWNRDLDRGNLLQAEGWIVIRVGAALLQDLPGLLRMLARILATR